MGLKTKLNLGLGFLFVVILLIGGLSVYYLNGLSSLSGEADKDNDKSLVYVKNMLEALDEIKVNRKSGIEKFENNLVAQQKNITEAGEKDATEELKNLFVTLARDTLNEGKFHLVREKLFRISEINMAAIEIKNKQAHASVSEALIYMSVIVSFSIIIGFSFILSFPGYIANPIRELTEKIKDVANKNYDQRVYFKSNDEFGELADAFNEMAQRLDEYEHSNLAQIISQKKRIETIINSMNDPVIGLDEYKKILFVNEQAQKLLGMNEKDLIDQYAPDIAIHNDLIRTLLKEEATVNPLKIYADERESYFTKEIITIHSQEKEVGKVILLRNVTSFKELDLAKTNFIATVSHELKTPLSSIQLCAKLLEDNRVGELNAEQKEILGTVKSETDRLMKITGELLDLSQVESGNIQLHAQQVQPAEIVNYAYGALKFPAEQRHIAIDIHCPDGLPSIQVDLEKTAWVLVNFLSNAIRYSPENGKVTIEVMQNNNALIFKVTDSGKGIDPQHKDKIFNKFYKVPDASSIKTGTGLGLAISKEFIAAQGGKIWVESDLGKGSTFGFSFAISS